MRSDMRDGYHWDSLRMPKNRSAFAVCLLRRLGATARHWNTYLSEEDRMVLNPPFLNDPQAIMNRATDHAGNR